MLFVGIFLVIILAYALSHIAVYFSLIRFFGIASPLAQKTMVGVLVFLATSFFLAMFLAHVQDNFLSRAFYFSAGFWIGLLVNLIMFFALAWIVILASRFFHVLPNEKMIGTLAVAGALIFSLYGVWNAFNPVIKKIDVSIDNLPKAWVGKKIVQVSDLHLGHTYRAQYMSDIADKINLLKPDVIVITGDLFDGTDGTLQTFVAPLKKMQAPEGVYFVTGNHETYLGLDKALGIIRETNIIPLRDELKLMDGLQFIGIDYPLRGASRDIAKIIPSMPEYDSKEPIILLIHEPVQTEAAKKLGISLQLSGHTHKGQLFPFGFITSLIYGEYDYGFKRDGSYAIYTSSGLGGWGPPMRSEKRSEIVEITLR